MSTFVAGVYARPASTWRPMGTTPVPLPRATMRSMPDAPVVATPPAAVDPEARVRELEEALETERAAHAATRDTLAAEREGSGRATAQVEEEVARLRGLAEGMIASRRRLVDEIREGVGGLVLASARKLAGEALRTQPELIEALVMDAVATLGRDGLVVRVAPADVERTRCALVGTGAEVVADASVEGGCTASTPYGSVDGSVRTADAALRLVIERWQTAGWQSEPVE
jgi:flagellar biosynthesis/type III secretory pathway protein FliH